MSAVRIAVIVACAAVLPACSWFCPEPEIKYVPVPEAYVQECPLPSAPRDNGDLSEAFVVAYQCAEQGNKDKARIKALATDHPR